MVELEDKREDRSIQIEGCSGCRGVNEMDFRQDAPTTWKKKHKEGDKGCGQDYLSLLVLLIIPS